MFKELTNHTCNNKLFNRNNLYLTEKRSKKNEIISLKQKKKALQVLTKHSLQDMSQFCAANAKRIKLLFHCFVAR